MVEIIKSQDKPTSGNCLHTMDNHDLPPGASSVQYIAKRSTEWYCHTCAAFIRPIWIRSGRIVFPACRECFFDDLPLTKSNLGMAKEVTDVAFLEEVPATKPANADLSSN